MAIDIAVDGFPIGIGSFFRDLIRSNNKAFIIGTTKIRVDQIKKSSFEKIDFKVF